MVAITICDRRAFAVTDRAERSPTFTDMSKYYYAQVSPRVACPASGTPDTAPLALYPIDLEDSPFVRGTSHGDERWLRVPVGDHRKGIVLRTDEFGALGQSSLAVTEAAV